MGFLWGYYAIRLSPIRFLWDSLKPYGVPIGSLWDSLKPYDIPTGLVGPHRILWGPYTNPIGSYRTVIRTPPGPTRLLYEAHATL
eukprot:7862434-Pyramimonas_sp.AAC.1